MMSFLEEARRYSLTLTSTTRDNVLNPDSPRSARSFVFAHFHSLSTTRLLAIVSTFIIGFAFTVTMKYEHVLWLATSNAGATPLLQFGQGGTFDYPGLRFGADKKFSITVFSDLHFGERKFPAKSTHKNLTDGLQLHGSALTRDLMPT
jgi:hypothetical protein